MKSNTALRLMLVLVLLGCVAGGLAMIRGIIADKMSVVATQRAQEDRTRELEFGDTLRSNLQELTRKEEVIKGSFINGARLVEFIESVEEFGTRYNLEIEIDSVAQGEPRVLATSPGKLIPVTFSVLTEGTYPDVSMFVDGLGNFGENLDVEQLGLFSSSDGTYTVRLTIKGMMLSYE